MQRSNRSLKLSKVSWLILSLIFSTQALQAQSASTCNSDPVRFSQEFLTGIYPELSGKKMYMTLEAKGRFDDVWNVSTEFNVRVKRYPDSSFPVAVIEQSGHVYPFHNDLVASGVFLCSKTGINKFVGGGAIISEARWETFVKSSDEHPEWSDDQALKALKEAGAQFGPDKQEEFLKQVPFPAIEKSLGKLEIKSTHFDARMKDREDYFSQFYWTIVVSAHPSPKVTQSYRLFFEPFSGKLFLLTAIREQESAPTK